MKQKTKIFLTVIVFVIIFAVASVAKIKAGTSESGMGFLWGGGTEADGSLPGDVTNTNVGWISMNSESTKATCDVNNNGFTDVVCGGADNATTPFRNYGVNIPATGALSGNAWSENLGYINFAPASSYPTTGCSGTCPTTSVVRNGDNLEGWARFEEISLAGSNAGGWLGWIKMRGIAQNGNAYGVSINTTDGTLTGYGYSDELGWIDFSRASLNVSEKIQICSGACDASTPIANLAFLAIGEKKSNIKACKVPATATDCNGADVTVDPGTTWASNDVGVATVNKVGISAEVVAISFANTTINCSYVSGGKTYTGSVPVSVTAPVCTCDSATKASTCAGAKFNDSCGNNVCIGSKNCPRDTNWKEVPVQ